MEQLFRNKSFLASLAVAAAVVGIYNWISFFGGATGRPRPIPTGVARVESPSPPQYAFPLYDAYIVVGEPAKRDVPLLSARGGEKYRNPFLAPGEERASRERGGPVTTVAALPAAQPIKINGILIGKDRRVAVVNGRAVSVGDRVGNEKVLAIEPDRLVLERNGRRRIVRVLPAESPRIQIGPSALRPEGPPP